MNSATWCVLYLSAHLVQQTAALVALPAAGGNDLRAEEASRVALALDALLHLLRVLLLPGCRRRALLEATVGVDLASKCGRCSTCDRCAAPGSGTCCLTQGCEAEVCLEAEAHTVVARLLRAPRPTFHTALSCHQWGCLPPEFDEFSACGLLLLMLAQGVLHLAVREGVLDRLRGAWRRERVLLTISPRFSVSDGAQCLTRARRPALPCAHVNKTIAVRRR